MAVAKMPETASVTLPIAQITGLILAGGRGTRMGTVDKGLQSFRGAPMVQTVLQRLAPQVGTLMINANQNLARYRECGVPAWPDEFEGFAGPLAGLHAGLSHCATPYLVCVPCDSPFLPADLVQKLATALVASGADLAMAVTGTDATRQTHPVFCLMKTTLLPQLTHYLQTGGRKVEAWYRSGKLTEVLFEDESAFANINTEADLRRLE
ncbi:MAG: molybdopterin-guanine dinucleotide biosynthesis protein [Pseudomonadota bacterium]